MKILPTYSQLSLSDVFIKNIHQIEWFLRNLSPGCIPHVDQLLVPDFIKSTHDFPPELMGVFKDVV